MLLLSQRHLNLNEYGPGQLNSRKCNALQTLQDAGFTVPVNYSNRDNVGAHVVRECPMAELQAEVVEEAVQELDVALTTLKTRDAEIAHLRVEVSRATPKGCGGSFTRCPECLLPLPSSSHLQQDTSRTGRSGSNPG